MLGIKYPEIADKLSQYKDAMKAKINADDAALQEML
jgi:phosphoribosylcarboxyaminoimidazole (NCAIR) mutase